MVKVDVQHTKVSVACPSQGFCTNFCLFSQSVRSGLVVLNVIDFLFIYKKICAKAKKLIKTQVHRKFNRKV